MSNNKEYIFVFKNGGWWLKIDSVDKLIDYHEKTESKWSDIFYNLITSKEFGSGMNHANAMAFAVGLYGSNHHLSPINTITEIRKDIIDNQFESILKHGEIYINSNGGWHFKTSDDTYKQWIRKNNLVFPNFKKEQIRIERFPGGTHYYAYIGNMQVRDGNVLKWNTYDEAFEKAKELI